jgi:uncharacterized protein YsxB (DUF464 family)
MIKVEISRHPLRIASKGHAVGAGDPGFNLVCCSVSTLMYTLVEAADAMDIPNTCKLDDGFMDVTFTPRPAKAFEADVIFKTIFAGLVALATQYPDYIYLRKEYD